MQQLNILLFDALDRYRVQVRPPCGFTDGQRIAGIALATAYERGDVLGGYQQHLSQACQAAGEDGGGRA